MPSPFHNRALLPYASNSRHIYIGISDSKSSQSKLDSLLLLNECNLLILGFKSLMILFCLAAPTTRMLEEIVPLHFIPNHISDHCLPAELDEYHPVRTFAVLEKAVIFKASIGLVSMFTQPVLIAPVSLPKQ